MRNLLMALAVVALLAAPGWAGVKVQVLCNKTTIAAPSETATVTVQVQADPTSVGVASLAGDIVASGAGGVTASAWTFGTYFNRVGAGSFPSTVPSYTGGSVLNFGSMQALTDPADLPDETGTNWGGGGQWATFGTYTVTAATAGSVTLTFSAHWQDGFKLDDTADNQTLVSNAPVTITVTGGAQTWHMCFGDYTQLDGTPHVVNDNDLLAFGSLFGLVCQAGNPQGYWMGSDFDLDGDCDDADLLGFGSFFGTEAPCVDLTDADLAGVNMDCRASVP